MARVRDVKQTSKLLNEIEGVIGNLSRSYTRAVSIEAKRALVEKAILALKVRKVLQEDAFA